MLRRAACSCIAECAIFDRLQQMLCCGVLSIDRLLGGLERCCRIAAWRRCLRL